MLKKILHFVKENSLLEKSMPIICAVSGGVDSIVLLHILYQLQYHVVLAHVNHHKRKQSDFEQLAMQEYAHKLNIPFELFHYKAPQNKGNFQKEAHEARYVFFKKVAEKYHTNQIVTAHHLNDQTETILMRLISGSNLYGYAGIAIKKIEENYHISRPLLCVSKKEIYQYAKENHLVYFEDDSNTKDSYLRNRIRHHFLPLFEKENPNYLNKFQEFSLQVKDSFNFIRKQSINYLNEFKNNIEITSFSALDIALKKDVLCLLFESHHIEKNYPTIMKCLELIQKNKNVSYSLKDSFYFQVEYGFCKIVQKQEVSSYNVLLSLEDVVSVQKKYKFYFSKKIPQNNEKYIKLCYNDLKLPFLIRNRKNGDFIQMSYGNKKVSRIFIDEKIPLNQREKIPLIFDSSGQLLWIYSIAKSQEVINQKENGDMYFICEETLK